MPLYLYRHPETEEVIEVLQSMKDEHVYFDEEGVEWKRVWTVPQASIDTDVDPFSPTAFLEKTKGKGSIGDLMDRSKDLSEKRKEVIGEGRDPVEQTAFDNYAKARNGKRHLNDPKRLKK